MENFIKTIIIVDFVTKKIEFDINRDPCHLTGKYRNPAHNKCNTKLTQKKYFFPFNFHIFSNFDCHLFFKKLVDRRNDRTKFDIIPTTNEENLSVTYGCIRFIDRYQFLSSSLDLLVKTIFDHNQKTLRFLIKKFIEKII